MLMLPKILMPARFILIGSTLLAMAAAAGCAARSSVASPTYPVSAGKALHADGFIQRWLILEPIGASGLTDSVVQAAVRKEYFPNQLTVIPHDGDKVMVGGTELTWHAVDTNEYNVNLYYFASGLGKPTSNVLFWAVTIIHCPQEMPEVRLAIGSNAASVWWVNGQEVIGIYGDRQTVIDDGVSKRLTLKQGPNVVRCAIINGGGATDFCARFLDGEDKPLTGFTVGVNDAGMQDDSRMVSSDPVKLVSMKGRPMNKSIFAHLAASILLAGSISLASAAETATQTQPAASATAPAATVKLPFATPLRWKSTGVLVKPVSDPNHTIVSVKDPTIVRYNDLWHIYATAYSTSARTWTMVYLNFKNWSDAPSAKLTFIDVNPNFTPNRYNCAPHLFYFTPHKKWYLVFQSQPPQYCTTEDISKPETWTKPQNFFEGRTAGMPRLPIDYHMICDDTHAYLFFTGDDGNFYRSRTRIEDFPKGMSNPEIAIKDRRDNLFEASITYKIKGTETYLTIIEALSPARYYRAWTSDRLDGRWTPVPNADTWQKPFAGINNVAFDDGVMPWTRDISHGELIRDGYDERMILDPNHLQLLYQGRDPASGGRYELLPYQLGLLTLDRFAD